MTTAAVVGVCVSLPWPEPNSIASRSHQWRMLRARARSYQAKYENEAEQKKKQKKQMVNEKRNSIASVRLFGVCVCVTETHAERRELATVERKRCMQRLARVCDMDAAPSFHRIPPSVLSIRMPDVCVCVRALACICKPFFYGFRVSFIRFSAMPEEYILFTADSRMH